MFRRVFLLSMLCLPFALAAQTYTLDQLISTGLDKATSLRTERLTVQNARSSLHSSYYNALPEASIDGNARNTDYDDYYGAGLTLSRSFSLDEPSYFNIRQAQNDYSNEQLTLKATRQQIVYDIFDQYLSILEAQKSLAIDRENFALQDTIYAQTELQCRLGRKTSLDLQQSEVDRLDAQIAVQKAESALRQQREDLFRYLGVKDDGYDFAEAEVALQAPDSTTSESISITKQRNDIRTSRLMLWQSRIQFLPSTSLSFDYTYSQDSGALKTMTKEDKYDDSYTIMLKFSYPLYSFWEHSEAYHRDQRSLQIKEINLDDTIRQTSDKHTQLLRDWQSANETYQLALHKRDLAQNTLSKSQDEYQLGRMSLVDLDTYRVSSLQAQKTVNEMYYNLLRTQEQVNLLLSRTLLGQY